MDTHDRRTCRITFRNCDTDSGSREDLSEANRSLRNMVERSSVKSVLTTSNIASRQCGVSDLRLYNNVSAILWIGAIRNCRFEFQRNSCRLAKLGHVDVYGRLPLFPAVSQAKAFPYISCLSCINDLAAQSYFRASGISFSTCRTLHSPHVSRFIFVYVHDMLHISSSTRSIFLSRDTAHLLLKTLHNSIFTRCT